MRALIVLAIIGLAVWFFTIGIRVGLVGSFPTTLIGAKGTNSYITTVILDNNQISVSGSCKTWRGHLDIAILSPQRQTLQAVRCDRGEQSLALGLRVPKGDYQVQVKFDNYFGSLEFATAATR